MEIFMRFGFFFFLVVWWALVGAQPDEVKIVTKYTPSKCIRRSQHGDRVLVHYEGDSQPNGN